MCLAQLVVSWYRLLCNINRVVLPFVPLRAAVMSLCFCHAQGVSRCGLFSTPFVRCHRLGACFLTSLPLDYLIFNSSNVYVGEASGGTGIGPCSRFFSTHYGGQGASEQELPPQISVQLALLPISMMIHSAATAFLNYFRHLQTHRRKGETTACICILSCALDARHRLSFLHAVHGSLRHLDCSLAIGPATGLLPAGWGAWQVDPRILPPP